MTQKLNELSDLQSEANSKGLYAIDGKIEGCGTVRFW